MAEKTEDLNLPLSVVTRIIKDALPDGVNVSREARTAIARAASVFVLYATATANSYAVKSKRKTLSAADIIEAMKDMEFEELVEPLNEVLQSWKQSSKYKKAKAAKSKVATDVVVEEHAEEETERMDEGEHNQSDSHFEESENDVNTVSANEITSTKNVSVVQLSSDNQGEDSKSDSYDEIDQNESD